MITVKTPARKEAEDERRGKHDTAPGTKCTSETHLEKRGAVTVDASSSLSVSERHNTFTPFFIHLYLISSKEEDLRFCIHFRLTSDLQLCSRSCWLPHQRQKPPIQTHDSTSPFSGSSFQSQPWGFSAQATASSNGEKGRTDSRRWFCKVPGSTHGNIPKADSSFERLAPASEILILQKARKGSSVKTVEEPASRESP